MARALFVADSPVESLRAEIASLRGRVTELEGEVARLQAALDAPAFDEPVLAMPEPALA